MHILSLWTLAWSRLFSALLLHDTYSPALVSLSDPLHTARTILKHHPLLDGHLDLPVQVRSRAGDDLARFPYNETVQRHADIPRLRRGRVGGFFSVAYVECPKDVGDDFLTPTNDVRDTLEQIDVTHQLVKRWPEDLALATSVASVRRNFAHNKISHLIGIEGAHSLGNSLATLRQFADLGARYLTLTHTCHNAFADSSAPAAPLHGGLSDYGVRLVHELNRLGVLVDVSHTSDDTARQAIEVSQVPVIFSHSGARAVYDHVRNVPDDVLHLLREDGGKDGVVMAVFVSAFVGPNRTTVSDVANHVDHLSSIVGRTRVGLGGDFDGAVTFPDGLGDVTGYENLLAELLRRGWSPRELVGLIGGNVLRVLGEAEKFAERARSDGRLADMAPWKGRTDL